MFGGQLLAQAIVAGATVDPGKAVKSIHTVFAERRPASLSTSKSRRSRPGAPSQAPRSRFVRANASVRSPWCSSTQRIPISSGTSRTRPTWGAPPDAGPSPHGSGFWEVRLVDGVDISDPDAVGPAELDVWTRFPGVPDDRDAQPGAVAFATDGFLIGTAMRPHPGVGQSMAHVSISTTVVTHTLTFHEPVDAGDDAAPAREPCSRTGQELWAGPRVLGRRAPCGLVRAGKHDPRNAADQVPQPGGRALH